MKRTVAMALGVGAAAVLALAPAVQARGQEREKDDQVGKVQKVEQVEKVRKVEKVEKVDQGPGAAKVQKRVIVRHSGGAFLGIGLEEVEGEGRGARIASVEDGSPAEKAGLEQGDVVVRFDGESVRSAAHLSRLVGETPAGRTVAIEVDRRGAPQKLTATLGERRMRVFDGEDFPGMRHFRFELPEPPEPPEPPHAGTMPPPPPPAPGSPRAPRAPRAPEAWSLGGGDDVLIRAFPGFAGPRKLGLEYIDMGEQLAAAYKLAGKGGVLVTSVEPDGPAARAGLKAGDVLLGFDGKTIGDAGDLRDAVAAAEGGREVALRVQRDGRPLELKATLAKPELRRRRTGGSTL